MILLKMIAALFYPVGIIMGFLCLGSIFLFFRRKKIGMLCNVAALFFIFLFSSTFFSRMLIRGLESQYRQKTDYPSHVSAIVLLTASPRRPISPRYYVEAGPAADRTLHAVRLLKQGKAPVLVITGTCAACTGNRSESEAALTKELVTELFSVKDEQILLEENARTTREHGMYCKKIFDDRHWDKSIILVTSAYHMPRAVAIFKKQGFNVFPAPTDFQFDPIKPKNVYDFFPTSSALDLSTTALHEYYGLIGYTIFGWAG